MFSHIFLGLESNLGGGVTLLVYVDDIIITGASNEVIQALKVHLNDVFKLKDLGDLHYFLGLELACSF